MRDYSELGVFPLPFGVVEGSFLEVVSSFFEGVSVAGFEPFSDLSAVLEDFA